MNASEVKNFRFCTRGARAAPGLARPVWAFSITHLLALIARVYALHGGLKARRSVSLYTYTAPSRRGRAQQRSSTRPEHLVTLKSGHLAWNDAVAGTLITIRP